MRTEADVEVGWRRTMSVTQILLNLARSSATPGSALAQHLLCSLSGTLSTPFEKLCKKMSKFIPWIRKHMRDGRSSTQWRS